MGAGGSSSSPGMALPGPAVVRRGFSLILLLTLSRRRHGRCCVGQRSRSPLSALPHSTTTASGRSRARPPACRPAPPAARRSRRPERPGRSGGACVLLNRTRTRRWNHRGRLRVRPPPPPCAAPPLHTPLRPGTAALPLGSCPLSRCRPLST